MPLEWPFTQLTPAMAAELYDRHHEGVLITDNLGRLVYYNRRMSELDGLTPDEVLGRHILEAYNLKPDECMSTRCLAAGKPLNNVALYYRATDGNLVNALCNAYPLVENGRLLGAVCYTSEYTALADRLEITARNYARHPYSQAIDAGPDQDRAGGAVHTLASLVGDSPAFKAALATAKVAARSASSVLIYGETGTGKELFAQAIHNHSPRRARPFCPINCAAIPENLLEGILFGTVRGAFTGALEKKGLFEVSSGGTIFLDEVHTLPMGLQAKLLRVIQERRLRRVGSLEETPVDLKIISSINQSPEEAVVKGLLRPDLFYRLGVVLLALPPLRRRTADVPLLVRHFVKKYNKKLHGRVTAIEPEFLAILENYRWPGNVRELEHVVETAMNFAVSDPLNDKTLGLRHLQSAHLRKFLAKDIQASRPELRMEAVESSSRPPLPGQDDVAAAHALSGTRSARALSEEMEEAMRERLARALKDCEGNMARAARSLGLSRQNFYYKMKKYQIN